MPEIIDVSINELFPISIPLLTMADILIPQTEWSNMAGLGIPENRATRRQVFRQTAAPSIDYNTGDIWIDSDDDNHPYVADSTLVWISIRDGSIVYPGSGGWSSNLIFTATDYRTVSWGAASLKDIGGTTYSLNAGNTGAMAAKTYLYLDKDISSTVLQTSVTYSDAVGTKKILLAIFTPATDTNQFASIQVYGGGGGVTINGMNIIKGSLDSAQLLDNGDFEDWSAGINSPPDNWIVSANVVCARVATPKIGTYALQVSITAAGPRGIANVFYNEKGITYWQGRTVTFSCWVYSANPNDVRIGIHDGVIVTTYSSYHTGSASYELLTVTAVISAGATDARAILEINTNGNSALCDGAMCIEGNFPVPFASKFRDWGYPSSYNSMNGGDLYGGSVLNAARSKGYFLNLAPNKYADFEQYADGDEIGTEDNIISEADTADFYFGTRSMKLVSTAIDAAVYLGDTTTDYNIPVEASQKYILSFWAKGNAGGEIVRTTLRVNNGDAFRTGEDKTITTGWTRYQNIITLQAGDTAAEITFGTPNNGKTFWIDGVMLEKANQSALNPEASEWRPGALTEVIVNNLLAGKIISKDIELDVLDGDGDSVIHAGKSDFEDTENGFIIGIDDSDSNKAKSYMGNVDDFFDWNGVKLLTSLAAMVDFFTDKILKYGDANRLTENKGAGATIVYNYAIVEMETNNNVSNVLYSDAFIDASKKFAFGVIAKFIQGSTSSCFVGIHNGGTGYFTVDGIETGDHAGILIHGATPDWNLYFSTADGTTQTKSSAITGITITDYNHYKIVKTATYAKLYINGILKATNTTNLPDDTTSNIKFSVAESIGGSDAKLYFYDNFTFAQSLS